MNTDPGRPAVKIIAIGDELLEGRTADTNSQRIQRALGGHGVQVALIHDRLRIIGT